MPARQRGPRLPLEVVTMSRPRNLAKDNVGDAQAKARKRRPRKQRGGGFAALIKRLADQDVLDAEQVAYIEDAAKANATPEDLHALCRLQVALPIALFLSGDLSPKDLTVAINKASTQWHNLLNAQSEDENITAVEVDASVPPEIAAMFGTGDRIEIH